METKFEKGDVPNMVISEDENIQKQYNEWQDSNPIEDDVISEEELRNCIISDLTTVSKMPVEEYTLYQKYLEIHNRYPTENRATLSGCQSLLKTLTS